MLTKEDFERLTHVGAGTPMGGYLRRHWVAALLSEELPEPDGPPKRIRLLGEDLVAFRDTSGRVGILDLHCPHRGAALNLARNENCALQCIYHGWRINADGKVLATPNEPEFSRFKERIQHPAYLVEERGGFIWAYLGPRETAPPLPAFEWMDLDAEHRLVEKVLINCSWLHGIENSIDAHHGLHLHGDTRWQKDGDTLVEPHIADKTGTLTQSRDVATLAEIALEIDTFGDKGLEIEDEPFGFRLGVLRGTAANPGKEVYARSSLVVAPWYYSIAVQPHRGCMPFYVAVDDEHTMLHNVRFSFAEPLTDKEEGIREIDGVRVGVDLNPDFSHKRTAQNNWGQNRAEMPGAINYCGIPGVIAQDIAALESMTPQFDFTREHRGFADGPTVHFREMLLRELQRFEETGEVPMHAGVDRVATARSWQKVIPADVRWQDLDAHTLFPEYARVPS